MGRDKGKTGSLWAAAKASNQCGKENEKKQFELKRAFHQFVWGAGIIFALIPAIASLLCKILHSDNSELVARYDEFFADFLYSGSFLWLSITVLVMSLLDLLLFGMKKANSQKQEFWYKIFAVFAVALSAAGIGIYIDNIGNPIPKGTMLIVSVVAFILYAFSSGIVSFKIMKEG